MASPALPVELLAAVVALVAQTPTFDFLQPDWSARVPTRTLHSLCLTSWTLHHLAIAHLYHHVTLPTAAAADAFARTIGSDRWRAGEMAGKAKAWVRAVSFGQPAGLEMNRLSGVGVCEVLVGLKAVGVAVERVQISGVDLGVRAFASIDTVKSLHLSHASLNFPRWARASLPSLTHLHLTDSHPTDSFQYLIVDVVSLPALTHFASTNSNTTVDGAAYGSPSPLPRPFRHYLGLHSTATQLEFIAARGRQTWLADEFWNRAHQMTSLKTLVIEGMDDEEGRASVRAMLCGLPGSLEVLELGGGAGMERVAEAVADALRQGSPSVRSLKPLC